MDTTIILGIIGVSVTIVTSVIVLWRANSARKEREKHAIKEIVAILANILFQGQDIVDISTVESLVKSKARAYDVNSSVEDVLPRIAEDLVTKFSESEFITPDVRGQLVKKTLQVKEQLSSRKPMLKELTKHSEYRQESRYRFRRNVVLGTISALITGTIVITASSIFAPPETDVKTASMLMAVVGLVIATATFIVAYWQLKKREAKSNESVNRILEKTVADVTSAFEAGETSQQVAVGKHIVDFIVEKDGNKIPIEIKFDVDVSTIGRMLEVMQMMQAEKGIVISSSSVVDKIRKMALKNNIHIIDNITSEDDLRSVMSDIVLK